MSPLILIPAYRQLNHTLRKALAETKVPHITLEGNPDVVVARSSLLHLALQTKASRFVWIDDDMAITAAQIESIASHPEPFVSALYVGRNGVVCAQREDLSVPSYEEVKNGGMQKMACVGFGTVGMEREIVEKMLPLAPPVSMGGLHDVRPLFLPQVSRFDLDDGTHITYEGEDFSFCRRANTLGFFPMLDCSISVAHLKEVALDIHLFEAWRNHKTESARASSLQT